MTGEPDRDRSAAAARRERLGRLLRERAAESRTAPLTPAQRRLWFLEQLHPGEAAYHIPTVLRLAGPVDEAALAGALNQVVARHEALRSVIHVEAGEPCQRIRPRVTVPLPCLDLSGAGPRELMDELAGRARHPFDLASGPLVRAVLARTGAEGGYLALTVHHLVADGWSLLVLARELRRLYHAALHRLPDPLPAPPLQYPDYADWLERRLASGAFDEALAHFRAELAGAPPWIALPSTCPPAERDPRQGAVHRFTVEAELVRELRGLLHAERATLYMGLLAGFALLLHRLSGQDDVVIGSPVANRNRVELEDAVGLYANVVAHRVRLAGGPGYRDVLRQVRERVLAALPFQELPFEKLVEELSPPRDLARNPIFQVLFSLQSGPAPSDPAAGGRNGTVPEPPRVTTGQAQFDLALTAHEAGQSLSCSFEYPVARYAEGVPRMADQLIRLLAGAVREPDRDVTRLPLLSPADREATVRAGDGGPPVVGPPPLAAVARLAGTSPDRVSVVSDAGAVTFRELEDRVAAWAATLRAAGIGTGDPVLVSGRPDADLVAAFLAIARVGAIYLPVDPALPPGRVELMTGAVPPRAVLSPAASAARWRGSGVRWWALDAPPPGPGRARIQDVPGGAVAYVIFTSGSTGRPKPVAVSRAAMAHHSRALQRLYPLGPDDTVLLATGTGFDASIYELVGPLATGARLAALPTGPGSDGPDVMVAAMARHRVTALQVVPSVLRGLLDEPGLDRCRWLRRVYCGGEALPAELARRFRARTDARLLNMYGPTETTVDATSGPGRAGEGSDTVPIGRPIPGVRAVVVDHHLEPVPDQVAGELLVGGTGVAHGYLGDPATTADRFRPDPYGPPGSRAYRTGDLVRRRADGVIEFVGRRDAQVKVGGVRVELGEIEAALRRHPDVVDAVAAPGPADGGPRLVAAVVARAPVDEEALRRRLLETLPLGLVPGMVVRVDAIPTGPTGKADRAAVRELIDRSAHPGGEPPRTGVERRLARLWCGLLDVPAVGRHDSFFALGGHSLLATRLTSQVRTEFGVDLPLRELFANPTVAGAAAWLARRAPGHTHRLNSEDGSPDVRG